METARRQNVWTADNIVKSPFFDVDIPNVTVPEYIWRNIAKWADRTAVVCGITNRSYTYRELHEYSQNFAVTLRSQLQIKDGDVIGFMMYNAIEYPIAVIGAMQAGAAIATFDPKYTASEVHRQLLLSKPKIMIGSPDTIGIIKEAIKLSKTTVSIIIIQNPEDHVPSGTISFVDIINQDKVDKGVLSEVKIKPEDVVLLMFSSGTTGLPKAVELTNKNEVANYVQQEAEGVKYFRDTTGEHQDSAIIVLPFHHIYALSLILLHKLANGLKLIILPKFQPTTFLNALKEHKITIIYGAPPLLLFLGAHPGVTKEHLASVKKLACGAAPLSEADLRKVLDKCQPDLVFVHIYGATETSPYVTSIISDTCLSNNVGFAVPNTELRVVDSNGRNLGPNEMGEMHIQGPQVMKGYRDNPEATKNAITEDGWFRTGDLATINSNGAVFIVGRIKEIFKVKGHQVAPAELEGILKEHPDVADAAVIGIPDEKKGEVPKAFVVPKNKYKTSATDIMEFVSSQVVEYKRLKEVEFVEELPKSASGKILKRVLLEKYS